MHLQGNPEQNARPENDSSDMPPKSRAENATYTPFRLSDSPIVEFLIPCVQRNLESERNMTQFMIMNELYLQGILTSLVGFC